MDNYTESGIDRGLMKIELGCKLQITFQGLFKVLTP